MFEAIGKGFAGFFTWRNFGALLGLAAVAVFVAWAGLTPERVASRIPGPSELWDSVTGQNMAA